MDVQTLHHYQIFEKIGEGTNGTVYKAWDNEQRRQVALKILKPVGIQAVNRQVWHEIKNFSKIDHPNMAVIYDIEHYDNQTYIVSEFVNGITLKDLMLRKGTEEINPFELLEDIVSALMELHKKKYHGNLKPTNIMINSDNSIILLDPYLSPFQDFQNRPDFVIPYEAYHYIAPEYILGKEINYKADLFALGVIIYKLITGQLPFMGGNEEELSSAIISKTPDFDLLKSKGFNSIRLLIIQKLLSKNPDDRFFDTSELLTTLNELSMFDKSVEIIQNEYIPKKNPRPYLLVTMLIVLVFILWFVLTSDY